MVLPSPATTLSERRREERNAAAYARALRLAGGCVVELRPEEEVGLEGLGALLFTGGGDISPRRYGQPPHPAVSPRQSGKHPPSSGTRPNPA